MSSMNCVYCEKDSKRNNGIIIIIITNKRGGFICDKCLIKLHSGEYEVIVPIKVAKMVSGSILKDKIS